MNFLVVDDNRLLTRHLTAFLRGKGHTASSFNDPSLVRAWLEANPCDGIILDIGMPKIDGISLLPIIRVEHKTVPIIMYTGLGFDEQAMLACTRGGASAYASKGLGPSELYSTIMSAVQPAGE